MRLAFERSRQLMCSEVLEDPVLPLKEFFIILQARDPANSSTGTFSTSVFCLDCFEDLSRKLGLEIRGNFLCIYHLGGSFLAEDPSVLGWEVFMSTSLF